MTHALDAIPLACPVAPIRNKSADRERIEAMYLARQITKEEFFHWLKEGEHL